MLHCALELRVEVRSHGESMALEESSGAATATAAGQATAERRLCPRLAACRLAG